MKIVFVCTGNMCRSPFAECVFRKMLEDEGVSSVDVSSVGTKDLRSADRDPEMVRIAAEFGFVLNGTTTYMTENNLGNADLILAMSKYHRDELTRVVPYTHWNRIQLFNEYCSDEKAEVPDPHFQSEAVYRKSAEMIINGCKNLINKLKLR